MKIPFLSSYMKGINCVAVNRDNDREALVAIRAAIENLKNETYTCGTDYQKLIDLNNQIEEKNILLNKMYERYEYLNNINDEIERYKREKYNG